MLVTFAKCFLAKGVKSLILFGVCVAGVGVGGIEFSVLKFVIWKLHFERQ